MKHPFIALLCLLLAACGNSVEEQRRISKAERTRMAREDSLALKVAVLPTLDGMPLFVAKELRLFDTLKVDVRLKSFQAQMDCDEAMERGKVEGSMTDLVRAQRMERQGTPLRYVAATNAYWQFYSNRLSRIQELRQMEDKMVGMSRFSVTDMLSDMAVDSAKVKDEYVFRVQINDPNIRLHMLLNNEIDAIIVTEPQATAARLRKHPILLDSRNSDLRMGVVAFRERAVREKRRAEQLDAFVRAYDLACDSLNHYGLTHYAAIIKKYTNADDKTIEALPQMKFEHAKAPRQQDVEKAARWLKK